MGEGVSALWDGLVAGRSGVAAVPRLSDQLPVRFAAEAPEAPDVGDVPPKELRRLDRAIVLALAAAREALGQAGFADGSAAGGADPDRFGVAIGTGIGGVDTILKNHKIMLERGPRRITPFFIPMTLANMAGGYVAIQHGLRGPNLCHVTACASGAHAIGESMHIIARGDADLMLAGGTEAAILDLVVAGFANMQALSRRGDEPERASRPFDRERDGFVLGEGSAQLVLEREDDARARGATILAYLDGAAASADASHLAAPDADAGGAVRCMEAVLRSAGRAPADVGYVNAHATSTPAGDVVEAVSLRKVFGSHLDSLPVSSTKGATGHLLGAAGAIEALVCVKALETGTLPETLNLEDPDPECPLDHVQGKPRPAQVRVALSNSFGFGGVNAALLFETGDV
jgi:3-oxoacyl-[acyl-carrier-protein] synthase II